MLTAFRGDRETVRIKYLGRLGNTKHQCLGELGAVTFRGNRESIFRGNRRMLCFVDTENRLSRNRENWLSETRKKYVIRREVLEPMFIAIGKNV
jgi:hypothetical protein